MPIDVKSSPRFERRFSGVVDRVGPTAVGLAATILPTTALMTVLTRAQTGLPVGGVPLVTASGLRKTTAANVLAYSLMLNSDAFQAKARTVLGDQASDVSVRLTGGMMIGACCGAAGAHLYTMRTAESLGMPIKVSWRSMPGVMRSIAPGEMGRCSVQAVANVLSVKLFNEFFPAWCRVRKGDLRKQPFRVLRWWRQVRAVVLRRTCLMLFRKQAFSVR